MDNIGNLTDIWYALRDHMFGSNEPKVFALGPKPTAEEPEIRVTLADGRIIFLVTRTLNGTYAKT